MPFNMTISPDFKPDLISGWYIFNTWLQKQLDISIHIELVNDFNELSQAIDEDRVDLIYANPHDISKLVRHKQFTPIVQPSGRQDETIIVSNINSAITAIEDLKPGLSVATTDVPDVNTLGTIMLEPADILPDDINFVPCENFITVAKKVIQGQADIGFLLADAYQEFSSLVKKQLRSLITSDIHLLHHGLLVSPRFPDPGKLQEVLLSMHNDSANKTMLESLEISQWEPMDREETEFLIDLLETLTPRKQAVNLE